LICPKCSNDKAHRSHRRGFAEQLAGVIGFRAYRCHGCEHRFVRFRYASEPSPGEVAPSEREVRVTRSALRWKSKRREILLYAFGLLLFLVFLYFITRERGPSPDGG
jgi:hypothetical protein